MKFVTVISAILIATLMPVGSAAELPDCKLYKSPNYERGGTLRPHGASRQLVLDAAALTSGQDRSYGKNEPILNTDYKIVTRGTTLVATGDFVLKASWPTNPDFKFSKGQSISVTRELVTKDGVGYAMYSPENEWVVFLTPDAEFCNRAVITRRGIGWNDAMGHWTRIPDDARLEWQDTETAVDIGRLRIIYMGATAGAMHFQEVWVKGAQIVSSSDRQFDQFASSIQIAGLTFHVVSVDPESIRISYTFGPRLELGLNGHIPVEVQ